MKMDNNKTVAVLGSTGSVGTQALDAASELGCSVSMIAANSSVDKLAKQVREYRPSSCVIVDESRVSELRAALSDVDVKIYSGSTSLCSLIEEANFDTVIHSISGNAGIEAAIAAAKSGKRIGMANKEAIISAGELLYQIMQKHSTELIPVDSEHSAIFQCLTASNVANTKAPADGSVISRILLTASGGPFYQKKRHDLNGVTAAQALAHPTWKMGPKITIDCATMMNKGFEIIEASRLFGVPSDKIEVLIHRQSIIHSMVEYIDMTVIAQLATPDMRHCIRYAITYPNREAAKCESLDFMKLASLTFDSPDTETFPLLNVAREALTKGGTAPAALIAADEVAVDAFIKNRIGFNDISDVVAKAMSKIDICAADSLSSIFNTDKEARAVAQRIIQKIQ